MLDHHMPPEYLQCDFDSSLWKSASGFEHLFSQKIFPYIWLMVLKEEIVECERFELSHFRVSVRQVTLNLEVSD